jgi:hypothetical protein
MFWIWFARAGWLAYPALGNFRKAILPGLIGGVIALMLGVAAAWVTLPAGSVRWIEPNPWAIAGNIFSNFYEEFVWRGFLLVGLRKLVGFWPAGATSTDDIELFDDERRTEPLAVLHTLRQQQVKPPGRANLALADFVTPLADGRPDYVGV